MKEKNIAIVMAGIIIFDLAIITQKYHFFILYGLFMLIAIYLGYDGMVEDTEAHKSVGDKNGK